MADTLRKDEWLVRPVTVPDARVVVEAYHYSGGMANTTVLAMGLFSASDPLTCVGVAVWLPPAPGPARWLTNATGCEYRRVISLSRLAIAPEVPKNAASYLVGASVRHLRLGGWHIAISYADGLEGHTGGVYRACNWLYTGSTPATRRWVDADGVMRSRKCTKNLTVREMRERGWTPVPGAPKHRFVLAIDRRYRRKVAALASP
jgi:hypothetical protein